MDSEPATVLVADDEPHLLRLVQFRLEREGYSVLTAADGESRAPRGPRPSGPTCACSTW